MKRGDVYLAALDPVIGSEQGGTRPVVIIQNDIGNLHAPTVIAVPLTGSTQKPPLPKMSVSKKTYVVNAGTA